MSDVAQISENPDQSLSSSLHLSHAERHRLLMQWNDTRTDYPKDRCVHQLFEEQVGRTPDATAVVFENRRLTYRELNTRANRLAHCLLKLGVGPDALVGICIERSPDMLAGLLGILKAGGAYLPLDPAYPPERLAFMLNDSGASAVLAHQTLCDRLASTDAKTICLEDEWDKIKAEDCANPIHNIVPEQAAYVIYTSGSTGQPKGVVVSHANVVRLFRATQGWFKFDHRDVWTLFHSCAFDFSVWEIWGALLHGGRLAIVPYWVSRSPDAFLDLLETEKVTILNQTPSAFRQLIHAESSLPRNPQLALREIIFGGEALDFAMLQPWVERERHAEHPRLVNMYGITETTVHVTYRPLTREDIAHAEASRIGIAIPDLEVYILDPHMDPAPCAG